MPAKRKKSTGEPPVTKISRPKRGANKKVNYNVDKVFENIGLGVSTSDGDVGDHHRPLKKSQGQSTKPRKRRKQDTDQTPPVPSPQATTSAASTSDDVARQQQAEHMQVIVRPDTASAAPESMALVLRQASGAVVQGYQQNRRGDMALVPSHSALINTENIRKTADGNAHADEQMQMIRRDAIEQAISEINDVRRLRQESTGQVGGDMIQAPHGGRQSIDKSVALQYTPMAEPLPSENINIHMLAQQYINNSSSTSHQVVNNSFSTTNHQVVNNSFSTTNQQLFDQRTLQNINNWYQTNYQTNWNTQNFNFFGVPAGLGTVEGSNPEPMDIDPPANSRRSSKSKSSSSPPPPGPPPSTPAEPPLFGSAVTPPQGTIYSAGHIVNVGVPESQKDRQSLLKNHSKLMNYKYQGVDYHSLAYSRKIEYPNQVQSAKPIFSNA